MKKYLNKFYDVIDKIGKHNFILIIFIFIVFLIASFLQTFSIYIGSEGISLIDGIETYNFILDSNNATNSVTIAAGNSKNIDITISNKTNISLKYAVYYYSNFNLDYINMGAIATSSNLIKGIALQDTSYVVTIKIENYSYNDITINFGVKYGFENNEDLILEDGQNWVEEFETILEENIVNKPDLDERNLVPVYYDDSNGVETWKVADYLNRNNSWYDYENKMWANAVIIKEDATTDYTVSAIGTIIPDSDIVAFYVWIPRYKYRVWNLNRQGISESGSGVNVYAYPAYSNGIDIEFEKGVESTGNIECSYNIKTVASTSNLSDKCYYNGSEIEIKTTDLNTNYTDAWYTHPAFTFGDGEIEGFWVGKFETTGTSNSPTILPDTVSLRDQTVSQQFTTSRIFQQYISNKLDAHMLTNLEWGAVAYLAHSVYGVCNGSTCEGVNHNNSSGYYTGRSGGAIMGQIKTLAVMYSDTSSSSSNIFNENGYYNYKGYKLNSSGALTSTKDITKVASTTKNITGVYDMSGGAHDYVMGNMVSSSYAFYPSSAGTSWAGSNTLDSKYYDAYSYGTNASGKIASNRARLGDATAEILGGTVDTSAWKPNGSINGSASYFVNGTSSWVHRGAYYKYSASSIFNYGNIAGGNNTYYSFRSIIS